MTNRCEFCSADVPRLYRLVDQDGEPALLCKACRDHALFCEVCGRAPQDSEDDHDSD